MTGEELFKFKEVINAKRAVKQNTDALYSEYQTLSQDANVKRYFELYNYFQNAGNLVMLKYNEDKAINELFKEMNIKSESSNRIYVYMGSFNGANQVCYYSDPNCYYSFYINLENVNDSKKVPTLDRKKFESETFIINAASNNYYFTQALFGKYILAFGQREAVFRIIKENPYDHM